MLTTILSIVFVIISVFLTVVVLMQEGKSAGLSGSISGMADTYGERTRAAPWRASCRSTRRLQRSAGCFWHWY